MIIAELNKGVSIRGNKEVLLVELSNIVEELEGAGISALDIGHAVGLAGKSETELKAMVRHMMFGEGR